ncbi:MAG TPA: hypothetical protein VM324_09275, partial [Egibacteraceae bacterium]|nr:hypothetical protein [Egibacteraceae bacterium]
PPTAQAAPEPAPVPVAEPEGAPAPGHDTEPAPPVPPPATPDPGREIALDVRPIERRDAPEPGSRPLLPAGLAGTLVLANIAGHAVWADRRRDGPPVFAWRRPPA